MGKRFISVFLFMLFCIVIAFPGYGRGLTVNLNCDQTTIEIKSTVAHNLNFFFVIKKCLSKGISVVEEERPVEESHSETEDEHGSGVEESLIINQTITIQFPIVSNDRYCYQNNFFKTVALRSVPVPPPECVLFYN